MIRKKITVLFLSLSLAGSIISGCGTKAESSQTAATSEKNAETVAAKTVTTNTADTGASDLKDTWDEAGATKVNLQGTAISVAGTGASASGTVLTITAAGTYVLSGTLEDGQIVISAAKDDEIQLVLNGVDITNLSGAPIYASQCDKMVVTLAAGSENSITDGGENFMYADSAEKEPNAALFCKDDLTINGTGSLQVTAGFRNGIGTKDDLLIVSGCITIQAADHGIRGNDSITILDGSIQIASGGDGIQTNTEDTEKGWILIEDGTFTITSGQDAVQADTTLAVKGGNLQLTAGGGSAASAPENAESDSYKGLKASGDILIAGGNFQINSLDDSIHANGNVTVSGGTLELASGDDGIHADEDLTVSNGEITVSQSYEGLEGTNVIIQDGLIKITASDDGINAAGGSDGTTTGGIFGPDRFGGSGDYAILISGGNVTVNAGGDGLDSNGTITISGGRVISIINSTPDNEAIDCDGEASFSGGTIIYGGTGLGAVPGEDAVQSYVYITGASAGKEVSVKNGGQTIISYTPEQDCQYLIVSSPDIEKGTSYEVYSADTLLTTVTAGEGGNNGRGFSGGGRGGKMGNGGGRTGTPGDKMGEPGNMPEGQMGEPGSRPFNPEAENAGSQGTMNGQVPGV